jgi:hypothetical protein
VLRAAPTSVFTSTTSILISTTIHVQQKLDDEQQVVQRRASNGNRKQGGDRSRTILRRKHLRGMGAGSRCRSNGAFIATHSDEKGAQRIHNIYILAVFVLRGGGLTSTVVARASNCRSSRRRHVPLH